MPSVFDTVVFTNKIVPDLLSVCMQISHLFSRRFDFLRIKQTQNFTEMPDNKINLEEKEYSEQFTNRKENSKCKCFQTK
jgi:hypothetical protein